MYAQNRRVSALEALGRVLISGIFVAAGIEKLRDREGTQNYMRSKHLPQIPALFRGAMGVELGVAPILALGLAPRMTAPFLAAFLLPTSFIFHDFWNYEGQERKMQSANFLKNMAIVGGLLTIALRDYEKSKARREIEAGVVERRPDYLDQVQFGVA